MSQTLVNLNTKLTAHAATAGANKFVMGYIEDVHLLREQGTTYYPTIMVLPPVLGQIHNAEIEERDMILDITVYYEFPRGDVNNFTENYVTDRISRWALANDIGVAFIQAIAGDSQITIKDDEFDANFIPEGTTMENTVAVNYKVNVRINCSTVFEFETTWKTDNTGTSNDDQITLPLESGGTYDFTVYWGDGRSSAITAYNQADVTHTYSAIGTYTVQITGTINGWRFNNGGDKLKLLTIEGWGDLLLGNSNAYFYGCTNLVVNATDVLDVSSISKFYAFFRNCSSLITLNLNSWDVRSGTGFEFFVRGCSSLVTLNVSSWVVSSSVTFSGFAQDCPSLTAIAINNWDVTSAITMSNMLNGTTLTTASYDAILVGWEAQAVQNNVTFDGGSSKYTAGGAAATARQALIDDHSWTITDGGTA